MSEPRRVLFSAQKNEGPFILEWVAYHRVIGFTDIVVVSNDCTDGADTLLDALQTAGVLRHLVQQVPPGAVPQLSAAKLAIEAGFFQIGDWVMWLDLDEFLVPGGPTRQLDALIAQLDAARAEALALNWCLMGDDGQTGLPARFVSDRFARAAKYRFVPNELVKTLFRYSDRISGFQLHRPLWQTGLTPPVVLGGAGHILDNDFALGAHRNGDPTSRVALVHGRYGLGQVNHYSVRTRQLFDLKRTRGRGFAAGSGSNTRHTDEFFERYNTNFRDERAILVHEAETGAEMQRLLAHPTIRAAHEATVAHVTARLAALAADQPGRSAEDRS